MYDGEKPVVGPAPLSELGLLWSPVHAALVWGPEKNKIYFFRHGYYWRFHSSTRRVNNQVPRRATDWRGVPSEVDAAFQDAHGALATGWLGEAGAAAASPTLWGLSISVSSQALCPAPSPASPLLEPGQCLATRLQIRLRVGEVQGPVPVPWSRLIIMAIAP